MRKFLIIFLPLVLSIHSFGQNKTFKLNESADITISPFPFGIDDEITITIESSNTCNDFSSETIYLHSGVGTDANQSEAWIHVTGNWGQDDGVGKMTNNSDGTHSIKFTPRSYYEIPDADADNIKGMGMVFRNSDGSKKWKYKDDNGDCSDADYFIGVGAFQISANSPSVNNGGAIEHNTGDVVNINFNSSELANWSIEESGVEIFSLNSSLLLDYDLTVSKTASYKISADYNGETREFNFSILVNSTPVVEVLPSGMRDGINYHPADNSKVTLVLHAPNKKNIFVKGDFNDWMLDSKYQMKMTHADQSDENIRYWLTLENLTSGEEYGFQYFVDGEKNIADPYTEKVLDEWNDKYIPSSVYPNIKAYPVGKTQGVVSVFQTGQSQYNWKVSNFQKPEKEDLIIYELHIRDFVHEHSYQSVLDTLNYLDSLNINAIELMPINEFEGNESWGYNPSFLFAPDKYYGPKEKLKEFIDEAHSRGIAVIIDIVMNHSFGQSPFVQLYDWSNGDGEIIFNEDTPWFNKVSPNQSYKWGADFNHESIHTKKLLDSLNSFWLTEYKVDGFRFDFTKGFTNNTGDGWAYDNSRITILKNMYDHIESVSPGAYVILEHLADNSEEKVLANYGMMLWGNMVHNYTEAAMGYNSGSKSDLGWAYHGSRGWSEPNLIAYASSHDEERMNFKLSKYGASDGDYDTKELATSMERMQLSYMFLLALPGPKMIWQFDELGYDVSIDEPCRVCNKPKHWEYVNNVHRVRLYNTIKEILKLRSKYATFNSASPVLNLNNGELKYIIHEHGQMNAVLVGNFGLSTSSISVNFPSNEVYYDHFSGESLEVNQPEQSIELKAGEFKLFLNKKLDEVNLNLPTVLTTEDLVYNNGDEGGKEELKIEMIAFPNPTSDQINVKYELKRQSDVSIKVYNINGANVFNKKILNLYKGEYSEKIDIKSFLPSGIYVLNVSSNHFEKVMKIVVK
jgi:glycosidase